MELDVKGDYFPALVFPLGLSRTVPIELTVSSRSRTGGDSLALGLWVCHGDKTD